jgi:RNA polymerase sigma factor (sigma-70 family)
MRAKLVEQLRAALLRDGAGLTDGQLLDCFVARRDDAAFEALVRRHGPMVLAVCHRVLRNHHDSEDAFQATFLVLARKATSIVPREAVGSWLYGVAYRMALKARATTAKRRERQVREMPEPEAPQEHGGSELQAWLDKELNRLPDKYRAPLVLCGLEGRSEKEAAGQLGLAQGTLSSRLSRARAMLAKRLARGGVELSLPAASAHVPTALLDSTIEAARLYAAGRAVAAGIVSAQVAALTEGVLTAMFFSKLKITALPLVLVVGTVLGTGTLVLSVSRAKEKDGQANQAPAPPKENEGAEANQSESTTVVKINAAYGTNDALGDNKFLRKRLRVTGMMGAIRRAHGSYWLLLRQDRGDPFALCIFDFDSQKQLAELKYNQDVTIEGRCDGRLEEKDGPAEFSRMGPLITFRGCKIVSAGQ